jgi:putative nucleotidyltransferase with HDIG domain
VKHGFLSTRVGRRFLAVNLLTALVPVGAVAAVSFVYVRAELREQAEKRVERLSKSTGMTTLTYLASLNGKLESITPSDSATREFEWTHVVDAQAGAPTAATTGAPRALTETEFAQLEAGRSLLLLIPGDGEPRVVLARARLPWTTGAQPVAWAGVRRDALFGEVDEAVRGEDAQACLFETGSMRRVACTANLADGVQAVALEHVQLLSEQSSHVAHDDFFVSPEWRVVVVQPRSTSFAAANSFRNTFLLLACTVLVLIFAVSHAQIRRTTEPLARLQAGTRRLRDGDFGTPVVVSGDDEYAEVAHSFNGMASELHRQITLMEHLDAVDRSALGTHDTQTVVQEALRCLASSMNARDVTIAVVAQDDHNALDAVRLDVATGTQTTARLLLGRRERDELLANPRHLALRADAAPRTYLLTETLRPPVLVLPLVQEQDITGLIAIGTGDDVADPETWSEARRLADRVALAVGNVQLLTRLDALSAGTVLAFARAIDANSPWTAGHSERVTRVALEIGRQLQLAAAELDTLERGGLLHDIGKIAVPPAVLDKSGRLTDEEWVVMRRHPLVGCEILAPIPAFADALPIVRSHHERMDGTGYPDRLYGDDIPYLARVLAVADVFDALASDRPYRAGMTTTDACGIIQKGSGAHFDPNVVHAFMDAVHAGRIEALLPIGESRALAASVARARSGTLQRA